MIRIAVQSKGRLFEDTMTLLAEAGIKIPSSKRTLLVESTNFPVEILYLRDDSLVLGSEGATRSYYRRTNIDEINKEAREKAEKRLREALKL